MLGICSANQALRIAYEENRDRWGERGLGRLLHKISPGLQLVVQRCKEGNQLFNFTCDWGVITSIAPAHRALRNGFLLRGDGPSVGSCV